GQDPPPAGDLRGGQRAHARGLPAARRDGAARSRRAGRHAAARVPVPGRYRSGRGKSAVGAGDLRPAAGAGGLGRTADRLGAGTAGTHELGAADLGSRCAAGAVFQLRVLDESEQQAALQLRARLRGFELPAETSQWLQRRFPRDMRRLYELLDTLDDASLAAQRRLTIPFIREVLRGGAGAGSG